MNDTVLERLNAALGGHYRIERELGAGGMATVYLAHDARHDREVAIKVLRPELAAVVGAERFLAEIKTTASLQHPHILPLFDSGETDGFLYYVMPYVEGETLGDKLSREKQLPVDEAVGIARKVADALDYAHEHGVVHRDVKPGNILLSERGEPLVADFGIALAVSAAGGDRITETGLSLGTPHYMSPEQASGDRAVDHRSDLYSLGCVLYEMLVGDPPHSGATLQSVLAKMLSEDPRPVTLFRKTVPLNVEGAVLKTLSRVPADRFASARELIDALDDPRFRLASPPPAPAAEPVGQGGGHRQWVPWILAAVAAAAALFGWLRPLPEARTSRFAIQLPADQRLESTNYGREFAVAPDGDRLVYAGFGPQGRQLYVRNRSELRARAIAGTAGAIGPFFSPDGDQIGFWSETRLRKSSLAGGPAVNLADAGAIRGATWTDADEIVYSPSTGEGLWAVHAGGGAPRRLTSPRSEEGESSHRWPDALPGGAAVLMTIFTGNLSEGSVAVYDMEADEIRVLVQGAFYGRWVEPGYLAYVTPDATLLVQPFDPIRLELAGGAVAIAEGISISPGAAAADYAVSITGTLVYERAAATDAIVRVNRDGTEETVIESLEGTAESLRFSPDGRSLVFGHNSDVWVYDLAGGSPVRRTFEGTNRYPNWSPDGTLLSFASRRPGTNGLDLMAKPADGSGQAQIIYGEDDEQYEHEWTRDGRLVVRQTVLDTGRDIWLIDPDDGTAEPLLTSRFNERGIALSPDDHWLAYVSNESGVAEVYVRPFPGPAGKWLISSGGGEEPAWSPDGRELYYRSGSDLIAAHIELGAGVQVREREILFQHVYGLNTDHTDYDVHPREGWFAFTRPVGPAPELIWVDGWLRELDGGRQ